MGDTARYNIIDIMLYLLKSRGTSGMDKKQVRREPPPYREPSEHISDICRIIRLCFGEDPRAAAEELMDELDLLRRREDSTDIHLPMAALRERLALSGFGYFCVMLALVSALEHIGDTGQTPSFAAALSRYPFVGSENAYAAMLDGSSLRYVLDIEEGCGIARRFVLKSHMFGFVVGGAMTVADVSFAAAPDGLPMLYRDLYERGVGYMSAEPPVCVFIDGRAGSGRRTLAAQICGSFGMDTAVIRAADIDDAERTADAAAGACAVTGSVPVVIADGDGKKAIRLVDMLAAALPRVFVCADAEEADIGPRSARRFVLRIPPPDKELRLKMWEYRVGGRGARLLAERYRLTVGQIAEVCGERAASSDMSDIINGIMSLNAENAVCKLIRPTFRLDDLVAREYVKETLARIVKTAERLPSLMEEYGFERLFPYGRGLGVLFYGASGTGKTMSAYILAAELGLDVMKVDISRLEDKYIGETEKRISEVFRRAEENNCLLFFDEADSLFARRTEVTDSHDRHANAQTAHLLQKMEEYGGIVVLATNLEGNVDPAFRRRLHFALEFPKPDAAERAELWRRFVPEALPHEEIDFGFLADSFELTPAEIKWAALSAAVIADGAPLTSRHIISALRYEYEKSGVTFPDIGYKRIELGGEDICTITR